MAILAFFFSCAGKKTTEEIITEEDSTTQVFTFKDSCKFLVVNLSVELPVGEDSVTALIRDSLIAEFVSTASQPVIGIEYENAIKPYKGDRNDIQAMVDYYGRAGYTFLLKNVQTEYEDNKKDVMSDTSLTEEERKSMLENVPQWEFSMSIKRIANTKTFSVYDSQAYAFYGGAHGLEFGTGAITFDKANGKKISRFILPDATEALQSQIRWGLLDYYHDNDEMILSDELNGKLLIDGDIIPQPQANPFPNATGDSLIFTYAQYEIAPYCDGMPSFKLSVKKLLPYLTAEGKALLCR